ncbi:hypothetical protein E2C01_024847 [Portunus trituberculatus]|uniref:Uncharacterized protein n=1 Tax=Portunus trituberculatus TaxID=210409 RepID=A0A5B7EGA0_PORTR|nr:hypothetical protein [Portunus trituberculatus]
MEEGVFVHCILHLRHFRKVLDLEPSRLGPIEEVTNGQQHRQDHLECLVLLKVLHTLLQVHQGVCYLLWSSLKSHRLSLAGSSEMDASIIRNCSADPRGSSGLEMAASWIFSFSSAVGSIVEKLLKTRQIISVAFENSRGKGMKHFRVGIESCFKAVSGGGSVGGVGRGWERLEGVVGAQCICTEVNMRPHLPPSWPAAGRLYSKWCQ